MKREKRERRVKKERHTVCNVLLWYCVRWVRVAGVVAVAVCVRVSFLLALKNAPVCTHGCVSGSLSPVYLSPLMRLSFFSLRSSLFLSPLVTLFLSLAARLSLYFLSLVGSLCFGSDTDHSFSWLSLSQ